MKIKTGLSLIWALLIVVSTFTIVNTIQGDEGNGLQMPLDVNKKVWNGDDWVDTINTYYGEIVRFNITITYNKNCEEGLGVEDIQVYDILPSFLQYKEGNTNYVPSFISGDLVQWNLSDDYVICLQDGESVSIEFDTEVIDFGEGINYVEVTAYEKGCDWSVYGDDDATINVADALVVVKEVYDPDIEEWVDEHLGNVRKGDPVKFRITVTYNGYYDVDLMKCMVIEDFLPDSCLEYANNEEFIYPVQTLFDDPEIFVSQDLKYVKYDWSNKVFNLFAGESVIIKFEANVVQYCYEPVINCAYVEIYSCLNCPDPVILNGDDCATVNCYPPDSTIEKRVWDSDEGEWVEETNVIIGDIVSFKIDFTYYGNYNLSDISILDQLHPSMVYSGNANPPYTNISGNLIWWNYTEGLNDSETISIEFDALAVGGTGVGPGFNMVFVTAYEQTEPFEDSDTAGVIVKTNLPPCPPGIIGDTFGEEGEELTFKVKTLDHDGDDVYYWIDWGDNSNTDWFGPYSSGMEAQAAHSWANEGIYFVKAQAKDSPIGEISEWSFYPVTVEIIEPPFLSLNVTIKTGLKLNVGVDVENNGDAEINNIGWNLTVRKRGLINKPILWAEEGIIPMIQVDEIVTLTATPIGYGFINVTVKINAPGVDPIQRTEEGIIFWKFIYI